MFPTILDRFYTSQVVQDFFHQQYMGWACSEPKQYRSRNHLTQRWVHGDRNDGRPGMAEALVWLPAIAHLGACGSPFMEGTYIKNGAAKDDTQKLHRFCSIYQCIMYTISGRVAPKIAWFGWIDGRPLGPFKVSKKQRLQKIKLLAMIFLLCETPWALFPKDKVYIYIV